MKQFLALPLQSRRLFLQATVFLVGVKLALSICAFETLRRKMTERFPPRGPGGPDWRLVESVAWAVSAASRHVVGSTCLAQALVGEWLLARRGQPAELRIGVAKNDDDQLDAHAWLDVDGTTIIGAVEEMSRFTTLSSPGCDDSIPLSLR